MGAGRGGCREAVGTTGGGGSSSGKDSFRFPVTGSD